MAIPFAAAALRVGSLFAKSGQALKSGARAVGASAKDNVARTREKIARNQKVVNKEKMLTLTRIILHCIEYQ